MRVTPKEPPEYAKTQRALEVCLNDIVAWKPTEEAEKILRECSKQAVRKALSFVSACRYAGTPASAINACGVFDRIEAADGQRRHADALLLEQLAREMGLKEPHFNSWPSVLAARLIYSMALNRLPASQTTLILRELMDIIASAADWGDRYPDQKRRVILSRARSAVLRKVQQAQTGTL